MQRLITTLLFALVTADNLRERPPTTTTTAAPKGSDHCHLPPDARWRVRTEADLSAECAGLLETKEKAWECAKGLKATVQYVRTMPFDFCQARAWYAVPVDPKVGNNETFWWGVTEAWMSFPVVNTDNSFAPQALRLYGATESQGGTSCQVSDNDIKRALASGMTNADVIAHNQTHITIDIMNFLTDSYFGLDHSVILITSDNAQKSLPPKLVGKWRGLLAVVRPEECYALAIFAKALALPLATLLTLVLQS